MFLPFVDENVELNRSPFSDGVAAVLFERRFGPKIIALDGASMLE